MTGLPFVVGPEVQRMMADADEHARRETETYEARRDDAAFRAMTTGPIIRAEYQRRLAEAQAIERKAEAARAEAARQRQEQQDAYTGQLLMSGRQPRSIEEWRQLLAAMP